MNSTLRFVPDIGLCAQRAEEIFIREAGIDREGEKYCSMREEARLVLGEILPEMKPAAAYTYYSDFELKGRELEVDGEILTCEAFGKIGSDSIRGLWVFAATSGFTSEEGGSVLRQVYKDIWGTAFTDAVRELLLEKMSGDYPVSRSFGPGFYGMDVSEIRVIAGLTDFDAAGVSLADRSLLMPEKSCAGIVFSVNESYRHPGSACSYCKGSSRGCNMCYERLLNK